jgi:hypothetical protein
LDDLVSGLILPFLNYFPGLEDAIESKKTYDSTPLTDYIRAVKILNLFSLVLENEGKTFFPEWTWFQIPFHDKQKAKANPEKFPALRMLTVQYEPLKTFKSEEKQQVRLLNCFDDYLNNCPYISTLVLPFYVTCKNTFREWWRQWQQKSQQRLNSLVVTNLDNRISVDLLKEWLSLSGYNLESLTLHIGTSTRHHRDPDIGLGTNGMVEYQVLQLYPPFTSTSPTCYATRLPLLLPLSWTTYLLMTYNLPRLTDLELSFTTLQGEMYSGHVKQGTQYDYFAEMVLGLSQLQHLPKLEHLALELVTLSDLTVELLSLYIRLVLPKLKRLSLVCSTEDFFTFNKNQNWVKYLSSHSFSIPRLDIHVHLSDMNYPANVFSFINALQPQFLRLYFSFNDKVVAPQILFEQQWPTWTKQIKESKFISQFQLYFSSFEPWTQVACNSFSFGCLQQV